jgi:amino acid adenylation domain-containing protein
MVPTYIVELEKLPLNTNGKVNRKALPAPEIKAGDNYVAPTNETEEKLVKIWSELLNVPREEISTTANFFAIGGHSLKATILVSKIHKEFSVKLPLKEVFRQQTIKKMAVSISKVSKLSYSSVKLAEKKEYYALSAAQKRLYFIQQLDLQSLSYNKPLVIPMGADIKTASLENAFAGLVSRHESFRTSFITLNNEPVQRVYDHVDFKLDKKETTRENLEKDIKEYVKPFDLSKDILIRACLMHVPDGQNVLVVDMHHIIADGSTNNIVREDFFKLFNGKTLNPLKLQYKDFSSWQNTLIEKGGLISQKTYWKDLFSGDIPVLNLQTDYKRPERFTFKGDMCTFNLDEDETSLLRDLGKEMGSTLYMNMLAVLNTLFYRFSNQEDIIIGSGIAGRQHSDLQGIAGMFVNTLAMRNYPDGDKTYLDFLKEVSGNSIKAFENQDVQFEDLVDMLNIDRDISRNPVFDISMLVQNFVELSQEHETGKETQPENHSQKSIFVNGTTKCDMTFFINETSKTIIISIEYYRDIFRRETIEEYIKCFKYIVKSIIKNPEIKLKDINLLSVEEKQKLLYRFNNTRSDYPKDKTIHELFEEQVDKSPEKTALICDSEELTYKELEEQSNQLAHYLRLECGVSLNECIGIYMDNGTKLIVTILGILKSGCAYLPLPASGSHPEERVRYMINDASLRVIISEKQYLKEINKFQWECPSFSTYLCLDSYNITDESEVKSGVNDRALWEYIGEESVDEVTGGGWTSSYTGQPIPQVEMDEFGENILKKLEPHINSQTRILEIGCASGITMFRLAPLVELYYGTDLSGTILKKNEKRILAEGHDNILQKRLSADEIDQLEEKDFDLIIINSVIQGFDGHNYLKSVIRKLIGLLKPKGLMFFGDIMDLDLKKSLIKEVKEFRQLNANSGYNSKTEWNEELFLSRGFWDDLKCEETSIKSLESSRKIHTIENELTKFRYDVLISVDKNQTENIPDKRKNKHQHDLKILENYPMHRLPNINSPESLVNIIYTSGSTGKPKGVQVKNSGIVNYIMWRLHNYSYTSQDVTLQVISNQFDGFGSNLYSSLLSGGILVLIPEKNRLNIEFISEVIKNKNITNFSITPGIYSAILDEIKTENNTGKLRFVVLAGEKANYGIIDKSQRKLPDTLLYNEYGPTEASIAVTCSKGMDSNSLELIGKPISNTNIYILGENNNMSPVLSSGELCVSGDGLAFGYLNNPELTKSKFIEHPFIEGEKLYRTGDKARWLTDGNIEFLGRIDHQVKIRGFRIELGEIENVLLKHEKIKECVVIAGEENNEKFLCAYVVCKEEIKHKELRDYMSLQLPDYMLPAYFSELDKFPLTSNGKVNRKALPSPQIKAGSDYVAPANETEEKLAQIWSEVLNIEKEEISVNADFFALGGHSLKATILISKINNKFNVTIPLAEIFKSPTIRILSKCIINIEKDSLDIQDENLVLLKKGNNKENNLFLIHAGSGEVDGYIKFCSMLNDEFNYWGIKTARIKNYSPVNITIEDIASKYIEKIKIIQPEGPYHIAGWCIGGTITFEMIKQLEQKEEEVKFCALINTTPPSIRNSQNAADFSAKTELELISESKLINDESIIEKMNNIKRPDQIWSALINSIASDTNPGIIRKLIPEGMEAVIPDFENLNIQELIYYFNTIRSYGRARDIFVPETKNRTFVNFFSASKAERQNRTDWNKYCHQPVKFHKVTGDHFSIFKNPEVIEFAKVFDEAIRESKMK